MSSTNTYTSAPTCENCGRDKQATYICDPCCDKLNAMHRDLLAERDRLAAENAELRADLVVVGGAFSHANATLDRLREVVPEDYLDFDEMHPERDFDDLESTIRAILYPPEINNDLGKCESS